MAEADPIQRMKAAARRASGPVTVETQRSWYFDELDRELGRDPSGERGWKIDEPSRAARAARYLLKMIALAATVFALTSAVMLWRNGAFDGLMPEAPRIPTEKRWTIIAEPPPPERGSQIKEGQDAPPSLVEPPAPPPAAARPAETESDDATGDGE